MALDLAKLKKHISEWKRSLADDPIKAEVSKGVTTLSGR